MAAYAWVITAVGLIGIKLEAWIWTGSVSVLASQHLVCLKQSNRSWYLGIRSAGLSGQWAQNK
jgi:hypothetical protein